MQDSLGDRMKMYEEMEAGRRFLPGLPIMVRLDGKSFHTFTKGMKRPYDERMSKCMIETTKYLVEKSHALIGYTQSDEISLVYITDTKGSEMFFDRRIQKLTSVLASIATAKFNELIGELIPEKKGKLAFFDCRVWQLPSKEEAVNCLYWREKDSTKNSISMAARTFYSDKELFKKNGSEKQEMLFQKGVNWNDYPVFFKRGTYVARRTYSVTYNETELSKLPEKHSARLDPSLTYTRSKIVELDLPILSTIKNTCEVIFNNAEPEVKSEIYHLH